MRNRTYPEQIFYAACNGDLPALRAHYEHGGARGIRINRFGETHSPIAAAVRNRQTATVYYLIAQGETSEQHERPEIAAFCRMIEESKKGA